jgi:hypothetical protein
MSFSLKKVTSFVFIFLSICTVGASLLSSSAFAVNRMLADPGGGGGSGGVINTGTDFQQAVTSGIQNDSVNLQTLVGGCKQVLVDSSGKAQGQAPLGISCGFLQLFSDLLVGSKQGDATNGQSRLYYPGAVMTASELTAQLYSHPPASSVEYVADVIQNIQRPFGVKPAYAQGIGYSSLAPVLELWKLFRNLAYFFFVLIFLIIGFMIMFRAKIGSQAAITVQQALPKLVISLILVTFSYAIAGLLIDVMYLVISLIVAIFSTLFADGQVPLRQIAFQNNIVQNIFGFIGNGVVGNIAGAIGNIATSALGLSERDLGGAGIQGLANILVTLVLAISVVVSLFRIFFALLSAYFNIFLAVIFAPLQLLIGALPGKNVFGDWIKNLLENLMIFPILITLIFIAYYFSQDSVTSQSGFSPPQLSTSQGAGLSTYKSLIALGALLAMPEIVKLTKGIMKGQVDLNMGDLQKNFTAGVPLATRAAFGGVPAAISGGRNAWKTYREGGTLGEARGAFVKGAKESKAAKWGVSGAALLSKSLGANQPDYLNPITNRIDKWASPEEAKRQETLQLIEYALKANSNKLGTTGTTPPTTK